MAEVGDTIYIRVPVEAPLHSTDDKPGDLRNELPLDGDAPFEVTAVNPDGSYRARPLLGGEEKLIPRSWVR